MDVKFIKPVKGYAYFAGDVAALDDKEAERLIRSGFAYKVSRSPSYASDLPADFPAREILIREGLVTRRQVIDALPALRDVKGIGSRTYDLIQKHLIGK